MNCYTTSCPGPAWSCPTDTSHYHVGWIDEEARLCKQKRHVEVEHFGSKKMKSACSDLVNKACDKTHAKKEHKLMSETALHEIQPRSAPCLADSMVLLLAQDQMAKQNAILFTKSARL